MSRLLVQSLRETHHQLAAVVYALDRLWNAQPLGDRRLQPAVRHSFKIGERFARNVANRDAARKFDDLRLEGPIGFRDDHTTIGALQILCRLHCHLHSYPCITKSGGWTRVATRAGAGSATIAGLACQHRSLGVGESGVRWP